MSYQLLLPNQGRLASMRETAKAGDSRRSRATVTSPPVVEFSTLILRSERR